MAKTKVTAPDRKVEETRYYWCVNCGHHGDYGKVRQRGLDCELCNYDAITPYSLEEINDPNLDNIWIERFRTKKQVDAGVPKQTPAERDAQTEPISKSINKISNETLQAKLAAIRGL